MKSLFLILISLFILCGCTNHNQKEPVLTAQNPNTSIEISGTKDTYFIEGTLENNTFTATQYVNYVNKEEVELNELYFHLYANMYKDESLVKTHDMNATYPNGFNEGGISLIETSVLGVPIDTEISDRLIKINLSSPLKPGQSLLITFKYKTDLPNCRSRMGYYNDFYNLTSFYPVAAVYEDKWFTDEYNNIGDQFFTDIADYHISLTLPSPFTVAATGEYITTEEYGYKTVKIRAENVREAAICAGNNLKLYEHQVGGTTVRSYADDEIYGKIALSYGVDALTFYNNSFGAYPYSSLSIVESEFFSGGMEYPALVLISNDHYTEEDKTYLEWVIAHEVAHQWWYGVVGSDPINDSFIDESLTEFSTLLYTRNKYDEATYNNLKQKYLLAPYARYKHLIKDATVHRPITKLDSWMDLSMLMYIRGCMMYMDMENIIGKEKMLETLKSYYSAYSFDIVSAKEWKQHFSASLDYDWESFFNKWLYNKKA